MRLLLAILACSTAIAVAFEEAAPVYRGNLPLDDPAIRYGSTQADDGIRATAECRTRAASEWPPSDRSLTARLRRLDALLGALKINPDSQIFVFSKTSFQAGLISPRNPRAIYFNTDHAVGYVRGSPFVEITALDARAGIRFYTLNLDAQSPAFEPQRACLRCHQGVATQGVPGVFVGSVYPDALGHAARTGAIVSDHRTPFFERWGGWYVQVAKGDEQNRANSVIQNPVAPDVLTALPPFSEVKGYLRPVSDVVALLTLEHQTQAANLITRLGWLARIANSRNPPDASALESVQSATEDLLRYLLFVDEAPWPNAIPGAGSFSKTFPQTGPHDRRGRSLRDFDLHTRLFRYPLSYMLYSRAFDALPEQQKAHFFRRLKDVLEGADTSAPFRSLSAEDRANLKTILHDTKPESGI